MEEYRKSRKKVEEGFRQTREKEEFEKSDAELVEFRYEDACEECTRRISVFLYFTAIYISARELVADNVSGKEIIYHKMRRVKIQKCSRNFLHPRFRISTQ